MPGTIILKIDGRDVKIRWNEERKPTDADVYEIENAWRQRQAGKLKESIPFLKPQAKAATTPPKKQVKAPAAPATPILQRIEQGTTTKGVTQAVDVFKAEAAKNPDVVGAFGKIPTADEVRQGRNAGETAGQYAARKSQEATDAVKNNPAFSAIYELFGRPGTQWMTSLGLDPKELAAGVVTSPLDMSLDIGVLLSQRATPQEKAGALANIAGVDLALPAAAKGLSLAAKAIKNKQARAAVQEALKAYDLSPTKPLKSSVPETVSANPTSVLDEVLQPAKPQPKPTVEQMPGVAPPTNRSREQIRAERYEVDEDVTPDRLRRVMRQQSVEEQENALDAVWDSVNQADTEERLNSAVENLVRHLDAVSPEVATQFAKGMTGDADIWAKQLADINADPALAQRIIDHANGTPQPGQGQRVGYPKAQPSVLDEVLEPQKVDGGGSVDAVDAVDANRAKEPWEMTRKDDARVGDKFFHARVIDPETKLPMEYVVTKISRGDVYYRPVSGGAPQNTPLTKFGDIARVQRKSTPQAPPATQDIRSTVPADQLSTYNEVTGRHEFNPNAGDLQILEAGKRAESDMIRFEQSGNRNLAARAKGYAMAAKDELEKRKSARATLATSTTQDAPQLDAMGVIVENLLREGKPVPAEVLADYPDLASKYGKTADTPANAPARAVETPETAGAVVEPPVWKQGAKPWIWAPREDVAIDTRFTLEPLRHRSGKFGFHDPLAVRAAPKWGGASLGDILVDPAWRAEFVDQLELRVKPVKADEMGNRFGSFADSLIDDDLIYIRADLLENPAKAIETILHEAAHAKRKAKGRGFDQSLPYNEQAHELSARRYTKHLLENVGSDVGTNKAKPLGVGKLQDGVHSGGDLGVRAQADTSGVRGVGEPGVRRDNPAPQEVRQSNPVEPPAQTVTPTSPTSARQADINADREALGKAGFSTDDVRKWSELEEKANPNAVPREGEGYKTGAWTDQETVNATAKLRELKAQIEELRASKADPETLVTLEDEFDNLTEAMYRSGTEQGRALAARRYTMDVDMSADGLRARYKARAAKNGTKVDPKRLQELEQIAADYKRLQEQIDSGELVRARKRSKGPAKTKEELAEELSKMWDEFSAKDKNTLDEFFEDGVSSASNFTGERLVMMGKMAVKAVELGVATIDELVEAVAKQFRDRGLDAPDRATILNAWRTEREAGRRSVSDEVKAARAQRAKLEAEINAELDAPKKAEANAKKAAEAAENRARKAAERQQQVEANQKARAEEKARARAQRDAADAEAKALREEQERILRERAGWDKRNRDRQREMERLNTRIAELEQSIEAGTGEGPKPRKPAKADADIERLRARQTILQSRARAIYASTQPKKAADTAVGLLNLPRTVKASIDISAPGRQGWILGIANPKAAGKAFTDQIKALMTEEGAVMAQNAIESRPNVTKYKAADLYLAPVDGSLNAKEEAFLGSEMLARWKRFNPVRASDRAYAAYLNRLRADVFDRMADALGPNATDEQLREIARYINVASGRGDIGGKGASEIGKQIGRGMPAAALGLWSPRNLASRIQFATGVPMAYALKVPGARGLIAKEYAKTIIGTGAIIGIAKMALENTKQGSVSGDISSSDFGKIRAGDTRIDIMAGVQQPLVLIGRLMTGKSTSPVSGKSSDLRNPKYGQPGPKELVSRFAWSKANPVFGSMAELYTGEDFVGNEVGTGEALANVIVPLSVKEIYDALTDEGIDKQDALVLLNLFGISTSRFRDKEKPTN